MITRIVKLEFDKSRTEDFLTFFESIKDLVNNFEGCHGMKLLRDINHPNIVMTYSKWDSQSALDNYRNSETFGKVWPTIKPWFIAKPQAWSVDEYFDGFLGK